MTFSLKTIFHYKVQDIDVTYVSSFISCLFLQLLDMNREELRMVADHLGHNIDIHTDVYHLQSSLLEKTKVAKVLIAMENGAIGKYKGKSIAEMDTEGRSFVYVFLHELDIHICISCVCHQM